MGVFVDDVVRPLALPHDNLYRSIEHEKEAEQECQSTCDGRHRIERTEYEDGRGGSRVGSSSPQNPATSPHHPIFRSTNMFCVTDRSSALVTHFSKTVLPLVLFPDLKKKKR